MDQALLEWVDTNGLIKPQKDWIDSGNGILYTAVLLILSGDKELYDYFKPAIMACFNDGNILRTPQNSFGQEQFDNHMGFAAYCFFAGDTESARAVLWFGLTHLGFFNTDGKIELKDWLYRFPQVWVMYFIAAFPALRWLAYFPAALCSMLMNPPAEDSSGTQLAWIFSRTMNAAFGKQYLLPLEKIQPQFAATCGSYYGAGCPIVALAEQRKYSFHLTAI